MKNLLLIFSLFLALNVSGQTIQTDTVNNAAYVTIVPFKPVFTDAQPSTKIYVKIVSDNLVSECCIEWKLTDDSGNTTLIGKLYIQDDDYLNWNGNNQYPFKMALQKLKLTEQK